MNQNLSEGGHKNTPEISYSQTFQLQSLRLKEEFDFAIVEALASEILDTALEFSGSASLKSIGCFIQNNCHEKKKMTPHTANENYRLLPLKPEYSLGISRSEEVQPKMQLSFIFGLSEIEAVPVDSETGTHSRPFIYVSPFKTSKQKIEELENLNFRKQSQPRKTTSEKPIPKVFLYSKRVDLVFLDSCTFDLNSQFLHPGSPDPLINEKLKDFREHSEQLHSAMCEAVAKTLSFVQTIAKRSRQRKDSAMQSLHAIFNAQQKKQLEVGINSLKKNMFEGNCYLANLCISVPLANSALAEDIKHYIRRYFMCPSRFGWYLPGQSLSIECYSPERFIRIQGDEIVTEPIKGTVKVSGKDCFAHPEASTLQARAAQKLWDSKKERAEQHLVVDLLRNDLASVCLPGSVKIESLFEIRFNNGLGQMSSVISGKLKPEIHFETLLKNLLPAGSVTGTPKARVMEILEDIEPLDRGFYCGVCFDVRSHDAIEGTLLIRSLFREQSAESSQLRTYAGSGAGITALSETEEEISEIEAKLLSFLKRCEDR